VVAIPQIYRDKIASSVVGTPGVDPSAQEAGQGIESGATETAGAGFNIAIEKQNLRNEGEFASLMLQHSQNIMGAAENIKKQYADNPDAMTPALTKAMSDSLNAVSKQASNPFVKLMVERGDPQAQMWALRQINQDAAEQGWRNTLKHAQDTGNGFVSQAMNIGSNLNLSAEDMVKQTNPLVHGVGLLNTSIENSLHSEQAPGITNGIMKGIAKGLVDGSISNQPWKTSALLANPEVSKYFTPEEMKAYQTNTDSAIKAFPAKVQEQQIRTSLAKYPNAITAVLDKQKGYAELDAEQRMDPDPNNQAFYNYLKDISLNVTTASNANQTDKEAIKGQLVDEANRLGFKLPGQFSSMDDEKGFLAPRIDQSVKDLYKFRDDLVSSLSRKVISQAEFNVYNRQLLTPLTAATLKNNDPDFFSKLVQGLHSPFRETDPSKVDDFRGPYNIIERALKLHSVDEATPEYLAMKSNAYDTYFKALEAVKSGQLNALGRPYSPVDVAHEVMGEGLGKAITVKGITLGYVGGYRASDGMPMIDTSKEWQAALANAKNLKDTR
jgi:hypothetical protein